MPRRDPKSRARRDLQGVVADLATAEGVATLGKRIVRADILVNSLGTSAPKPFDQLTDEGWLGSLVAAARKPFPAAELRETVAPPPLQLSIEIPSMAPSASKCTATT